MPAQLGFLHRALLLAVQSLAQDVTHGEMLQKALDTVAAAAAAAVVVVVIIVVVVVVVE